MRYVLLVQDRPGMTKFTSAQEQVCEVLGENDRGTILFITSQCTTKMTLKLLFKGKIVA